MIVKKLFSIGVRDSVRRIPARTACNLAQYWCVLLFLSVMTSACTPSTRAIKALHRGDYCEFCRISLGASNTEPASAHNLGLCYEHGWCGFSQSRELAIQQYNLGARWGIPESNAALMRLGVQPPGPDLKLAQELADARERAAIWSAVAAGLASAGNTMGQQSNYNTYQSLNAPAPAVNYQGCCSYHSGVQRDAMGRVSCHFSGMVLCNDLQPSPSCRCR